MSDHHRARRRNLRFRNFDEVLAEAERLHLAGCRPLGNWSLGQTLGHLGRAMHGSIDGPPFNIPWYLKIIGRIFFRYWMLHVRFPAGFRLPRRAEEKLVPPPISFEDGLATLRSGIERLGRETRRVPHPLIGSLSPAQWNLLHLRHAELHLSFLVPE